MRWEPTMQRRSTITQRMVKMTRYTSATLVSPLATIDEFIFLSLACLLPFRPSVARTMNSPCKMEKSCCEKKSVFTIPQRHIYFILKGRFEVTLQSFPSDIFKLDILWHFQLNIADIPAEKLKACLKGTPALKLFLSLYLLPSLLPPFSLCLCLFILNTLFPSSSCSNTGLHALPAKCGGLASPGITRSLFNPKGLPKILSPRIHTTQTQTVELQKAYDAISSKQNVKIKVQ